MLRMFLCGICGNKRCPHAADHRLDCTGSNEPGQRGSLYESALNLRQVFDAIGARSAAVAPHPAQSVTHLLEGTSMTAAIDLRETCLVLAARAERGPDRDVDADIAEQVLGWKPARIAADYDGENAGEVLTATGKLPEGITYPPRGKVHRAWHVPAFTRDLNAALAFAGPGVALVTPLSACAVMATALRHRAAIADGRTSEAPAATPAAYWRLAGEPDPHADLLDLQRAQLPMGDLTDDNLANAVFLFDHRSGLGGIAYLIAAKERIRWLSRALAAAIEARGQSDD